MAGVNGIEIKVGQVWRCRDGVEREITGYDLEDDVYPVQVADIETVDLAGRVYGAEGPDTHSLDLIELVQDENGFTIWRGGACPVHPDAPVEVQFRNGRTAYAPSAETLWWEQAGNGPEIVAYKVVERRVDTADQGALAADLLSDLGWHFRDGTWVQDGEPGTVTVETPDSALAVQVGGSHYKDLAIQPIEYIHANKLGFCEGNVVKYITRHRQKHGADDIRKVIHYCQLLLELEYGGANRG